MHIMKKIWYPLLSVGLLAVSCDYLDAALDC